MPPKLRPSQPSAAAPVSWRQVQVFVTLFTVTIAFVLCKRVLDVTTPLLVRSGAADLTAIAACRSAFNVAFAVSKLAAGRLADQVDPLKLQAVGLLTCAVCVAMFAYSHPSDQTDDSGAVSSSVPHSVGRFVRIGVWALHGVGQGAAWAPCAIMLRRWFPPTSRGKWWSALATGKTVGGAVAVAGVGGLAAWAVDWTKIFLAVSALAILVALVARSTLNLWPQDFGMQAYDGVSHSPRTGTQQSHSHNLSTSLVIRLSLRPQVLACCTSGAMVYFILEACTSWFAIVFPTFHGLPAGAAASSLFMLEVGGTVGILFSGFFSDFAFAGRRIPVQSLLVFFSAPTLLLLSVSGRGLIDFPQIGMAATFVLGLVLYGSATMVGLAVVEFSDPRVLGTVSGLSGAICYLGAAFAGAPLQHVSETLGWGRGFYSVLIAVSLSSAVTILPLWNFNPLAPPIAANLKEA